MEDRTTINFPPALRTTAQVLSYILHPLFIPILVTLVAITALPEFFTTFKQNSVRFFYDGLYFRVIVTCVLFPLLVVVLARLLNFVDSIQLSGQKDRIIPYVGSIIFYFWAFYTFKREGISPGFYNAFFLGTFIAVVASFVLNSFTKISMHTVGWGGAIGFLLALMWWMGMNVSLPLALTFILAGLAATARLVLFAHTPKEVYGGFIIGIASQLVAYAIVG